MGVGGVGIGCVDGRRMWTGNLTFLEQVGPTSSHPTADDESGWHVTLTARLFPSSKIKMLRLAEVAGRSRHAAPGGYAGGSGPRLPRSSLPLHQKQHGRVDKDGGRLCWHVPGPRPGDQDNNMPDAAC